VKNRNKYKYSFFIPVEFCAWYVDEVRHGGSTGEKGFLFVFSPNDTKLCLGDRIFYEKKVLASDFAIFEGIRIVF
jgi:hypothetical protein